MEPIWNWRFRIDRWRITIKCIWILLHSSWLKLSMSYTLLVYLLKLCSTNSFSFCYSILLLWSWSLHDLFSSVPCCLKSSDLTLSPQSVSVIVFLLIHDVCAFNVYSYLLEDCAIVLPNLAVLVVQIYFSVFEDFMIFLPQIQCCLRCLSLALCSLCHSNICSSVSACLWCWIARDLGNFFPKNDFFLGNFFFNKVFKMFTEFNVIFVTLFTKLVRKYVNWWSKRSLSFEKLIRNETEAIA